LDFFPPLFLFLSSRAPPAWWPLLRCLGIFRGPVEGRRRRSAVWPYPVSS
jgi:hypothetical protein